MTTSGSDIAAVFHFYRQRMWGSGPLGKRPRSWVFVKPTMWLAFAIWAWVGSRPGRWDIDAHTLALLVGIPRKCLPVGVSRVVRDECA